MLLSRSKLAYKLGLAKPQVRLLVLCMENMCRSPLAAALIIDELKRQGADHVVSVKSAGVSVSMVGSRPDPRVYRLAHEHDFVLCSHRSKQVLPEEFSEYDLVLAVDKQVQDRVAKEYRYQVPLFLDCLGEEGLEIPDPYYGNASGFDDVYHLSKQGAVAITNMLLPQLKLTS